MSKMESGLAFAIPISDTGQFAFYAGGTALLLVLLLMIQVAAVRIHLIVVQGRRKRVQSVWRAIIGRVLTGEHPQHPQITRQDMFYVLEEFDYIFGVVRGREAAQLQKYFRELELPVPLRKLLKSYNIKKRLFAIITLGNIRDDTCWDLLKSFLQQTQPVISLSAARSLVLIDPARAVEDIVPVILARKDWPWANIAQILKLAGPKLVCRKLADLVINAVSDKQAFLLRLYDVLRCEEELPVTCNVLAHAKEDKVASVCLNISRDPNIIFLAREYALHERWHVRMNAAVAIGRFGHEEDIALLVRLLQDKEWWVRYRSAQSLLKLPCVNKAKVQQIRAGLNDKFADDILVQVINEMEHGQ